MNTLFFVLFLFLKKSDGTYHYLNLTYENMLSKSVIKVIEEVQSESIACISITSSNNQKSARQHDDIINDIAGGVTNGISIISSDDRSLRMERFEEQKRLSIVVLDGLNGFRRLSKIFQGGKFKYDGKYLIVMNNVTMDYVTLVNEIFERLYYDYIVNVNILIHNPMMHKEILMFTYYPYKPNNCSRSNVVLYNMFANDSFLQQKPHFPDKLQNFFNCTIVAAAFNTTPYVELLIDKKGNRKILGFEGQLFSEIAKILNLNIEVVVPPLKWGALYPNKTMTGAFELLNDNRANVTMGSFFHSTFKKSEPFEYTWSYHTSYLCIIIPCGRPITSLEKTMWPFRPAVWYTIFLFTGLTLLIQIPIKIFPQNRYLETIDILDLIRIYFGLSIAHYPVKMLSKMLVIGLFFYTLILRNCYQSSLFHFMTLKVNVSTVHSVNELVEENFTFYLIEQLHFVLESVPQIKSRVVFVTESAQYELIQNSENNWESKTAIITPRNHPFGEMIPIKENIYQLSIAMVLRRNSYFTGVFNDVIYKLMANGYMSKLNNNFSRKKYLTIQTPYTRLLSVEDVVGLFRICLAGYIVSVAVFGLEIASMILQNKKKRK